VKFGACVRSSCRTPNFVKKSLTAQGDSFLTGQIFTKKIETFAISCYFSPHFTAQRICIALTMQWQDVCLSVCLSVRPSHSSIVCKQLHISSDFFSPSGSPTILAFPYQTGWQYSDGDPLNEGAKCKGV